MQFLTYEIKVAAVLLVFYLFYRFLLKKETFHRFNRAVLVGTAILSFILPFCIITIKKTAEQAEDLPSPVQVGPITIADVTQTGAPWWQTALIVLFWAGAVFVLARVALSIVSIYRIIRQGQTVQAEDGGKIVVTERDIDPFSWMQYIVLSRNDYDSNPAPVIAHERAHIKSGHSIEVLLVDILSALQWFNPAIWMLRSDLKEIHEFEADDAVLRGGADIKDYQYLLIRKAVGKSGYSVANSFNHSILKNRITMMTKEKSPLSRGLRALYVLPIVCICLGLQAQTVIIPKEKIKEAQQPQITIRKMDGASSPLYIIWEMGQEREVSEEEFSHIDPSRISSMEILKDQQAIEKYGPKAANGVVKVSMKLPIELDEVVVVRRHEESDELIPFRVIETKDFPSFQGGGMENFQKWLAASITPPSLDKCNHSGTVEASFAVGKDGYIKDVEIVSGVCEELDNLVLKAISDSPKWEPAKSDDGQPKDVYLRIPIVFDNR